MPLPWTRETSNLQPRCRDADVDPDWWIDPDVQLQLDRTVQHATHTNRLRAKLLCYECPFLAECRAAGWSEPGHVWGGLTLRERIEARTHGHYKGVSDHYLYHGAQSPEGRTAYQHVIRMFRAGDTPELIAESLELPLSKIVRFIYSAIDIARRIREEDPEWTPVPIPPLSKDGLYGLKRGYGESYLMEARNV